jgi:hypothetical protein
MYLEVENATRRMMVGIGGEKQVLAGADNGLR